MQNYRVENQPTKFSNTLYEKIKAYKNELSYSNINQSEVFFILSLLFEKIEEQTLISYSLSGSELEIARSKSVDVEKNNYFLYSEQALQGFFSWRTAIRKVMTYEEITENSLEDIFDFYTMDWFIFLYMYELINLIGIDSPAQGFRNLHRLKILFKNINNVHRYREIVEDYGIYYGLKLPQSRIMLPEIELLYKNNYINNSAKSYYTKHSAYNYLISSFYSQTKGYLIEEIMPFVLEAIYKYMEKKRIKISLLVVGSFSKREWKPFEGCPFLERNKQNPISTFNPHHITSYSYDNGEWIEHHWSNSYYAEAIIGYMYKITEKYLREYYHFNNRITVNIDRFLPKDRTPSNSESEMYKIFRMEIYGSECSQLIKKTVFDYIKMKEEESK